MVLGGKRVGDSTFPLSHFYFHPICLTDSLKKKKMRLIVLQ